MFGSLSDEVEVKVAAEKAWQMYGTLELADIAAKNILESLEVIEGDGGVGTIVKVTFKPGTCYTSTHHLYRDLPWMVLCFWLSKFKTYKSRAMSKFKT